ncbi:SAM-dependent methyltransferase [Intrasporangium calvum]|uniref:SAM-dependent methyltransferase n=1 Tax=Intrasporangium calvum TaxID=53358 RepID=UPI002D79A4AD|nr:SAM-dependent methyltransferase [Intrasporangium calvum]
MPRGRHPRHGRPRHHVEHRGTSPGRDPGDTSRSRPGLQRRERTRPPGDPRSTVDWGALARSGTTLVVLMGVATLPAITAELVAQGLAGDTPAAVVADAGMSSMRTVRAPLDSIAETASREGITAPAVAVVGAVAALDVLA